MAILEGCIKLYIFHILTSPKDDQSGSSFVDPSLVLLFGVCHTVLSVPCSLVVG